jgi:hypothetical protein
MDILASSANTWAAVSAIAAMITTLISAVSAFVYSRRQTTLTERAAANARTSATQALESTRLAEQSLAVASKQLDVASQEAAAVQRQVELGFDALYASERPYFVPDSLTWNQSNQAFHLKLVNRGKGAGTCEKLRLRLPDGTDIEGRRSAAIVPVGDPLWLQFPHLDVPPDKSYLVALVVVNGVGADRRRVGWGFTKSPAKSWSEGARAGAVKSIPWSEDDDC